MKINNKQQQSGAKWRFCIISEVLISSWEVDKEAKHTPGRLFTKPGRKYLVLLSKNRILF